jgi:hypothetical protein
MRHRVFHPPESYRDQEDPEDQRVRRNNAEPFEEKEKHLQWGFAVVGLVFLCTMWLIAHVFSYSNGPVRNLR